MLTAVKQGEREQVAKLLREEADFVSTDPSGRTSGVIAVHTDPLALTIYLIEQGPTSLKRDKQLDNPLLYA